MAKAAEETERAMWDALAALDPRSVCERAAVEFDPGARRYTCASFGQSIRLDLDGRAFRGGTPIAEKLLGRLGYFAKLSMLDYLLHARAIPESGRLVAPSELSAAQLYFRGSHVLPCDRLAAAFDADPARFAAVGRDLGGEPQPYGDVAVRVRPLPRIPVVVVLWRGDEEFGPRSGILFDASVSDQLAPDVVWSIAMVSILIFMA